MKAEFARFAPIDRDVKCTLKKAFSTSMAIVDFLAIVQAKRVRRMKRMIKFSRYLFNAHLVKEEFTFYTAIADIRIQ